VDLLPYGEYAKSLNRKRASAGVLFRDEQRRVLLVQTSYKVEWDIPGGAVEAGEPPWVTAGREVREELGIDRPLGQLLVIDYVPDDGVMPEGLAFIWDGGVLSERDRDLVELTDPEIVALEFRAVTDVAGRVKPRLARRLTAALEAAEHGGPALCADGQRVA
jgi:8-oxo-dGTP pyrophosphatase MutT (NUDIX family)